MTKQPLIIQQLFPPQEAEDAAKWQLALQLSAALEQFLAAGGADTGEDH